MAGGEIAVVLFAGVLAGSISGALGVGGGVIMVPALAILAGVDQHTAQGTSLLVIVPTAMVGAYLQNRHGLIRARLSLGVGSIGGIGAAAGALVALQINPGALRVGYAVFLALVGVRTMLKPRTGPGDPKLQRPPG